MTQQCPTCTDPATMQPRPWSNASDRAMAHGLVEHAFIAYGQRLLYQSGCAALSERDGLIAAYEYLTGPACEGIMACSGAKGPPVTARFQNSQCSFCAKCKPYHLFAAKHIEQLWSVAKPEADRWPDCPCGCHEPVATEPSHNG